MDNGDFWDKMSGAYGVESGMDTFLEGKPLGGDFYNSVRQLTDKQREENTLTCPVEAGTRVRFEANLGSVLSYEDIPADKLEGTVVTVRTSSGHTTEFNDRICVLWDDGVFRPISAEHMTAAGVQSKKARNVRIVAADMGDLTAFFAPTSRQDELVHKATKDLWSFRKDGDQFVVERLFQDDGVPLKV